MSRIVDLANELVAWLNVPGRNVTQFFRAELQVNARYDETLRPGETVVWVIPRNRKADMVTRGRKYERAYGLDVQIVNPKALDGGSDEDAVRAAIGLAESICEAIEADGLLVVAPGEEMVLQEIGYGDTDFGLYDREMLEKHGLCVPVVTTVWAEVR